MPCDYKYGKISCVLGFSEYIGSEHSSHAHFCLFCGSVLLSPDLSKDTETVFNELEKSLNNLSLISSTLRNKLLVTAAENLEKSIMAEVEEKAVEVAKEMIAATVVPVPMEAAVEEPASMEIVEEPTLNLKDYQRYWPYARCKNVRKYLGIKTNTRSHLAMLEEIAKHFKTTVEDLKTTNPITLSMEKEKLQQMLSNRIYNELAYDY